MNFFKIIILLSLISAQMILGCASSKAKKDNLKNITGRIEVVGNEPFTHLALRVNSAEIYILKCSAANKKLLESNQEKKAKIFYKTIDHSRKPNIITVERAIIIKNKD